MKLTVDNAQAKKSFVPFNVTLTAETIQEARLLFHICNRGCLGKAILSTAYTDTFDYDPDIASDIAVDQDAILKQITEQGFNV